MPRSTLLHHTWRLPLLISVVYVLLQLTAGSSWTLFPDSYRYARAAEQRLGESREEAHRTALEAFCTSRASADTEKRRLDPLAHGAKADPKTCLKRWNNAPDITTGDPRYQSIFSSRPGYPLVVAPFIGAFGVLHGMRGFGLVMSLAGALLVFGLLRHVGLSPPRAAIGHIAFLVSPLGWWSLQALSEGVVTVCVLGTLWGGLVIIRGKYLPGAMLFAGSLAVCAVTRYSTALLLAALIAATTLVSWCVRRSRRVLLLPGAAAGSAAAIALVMKILALPNSEVTLQDTFTRHFRSPEVANPWNRLVALDLRYWQHWIAEQAAMPLFLALTALALWALLRYGRGLGPLVWAAALTGVSQVVAHPLAQEADRLGVLMWIPVVFGVPLATQAIRDFRLLPNDRTVRDADSVVEPGCVSTADPR
ncbi:hypothetical protein AB0M87_05055 [Streptomyces sp. NPDC051320]|uniref:hypothetical protein n=1 Tax=Streptomyces sp. NPDC051320 TaxID=3154644 RepID=UPI0034160A9A